MIGASIGKSHCYRIVAPLGDGGMGAVYEATDLATGRRVAVKVLHPHLAQNEVIVQRFTREAQTCAALRHPNMVEVLDFQANPGEPPFIVMEIIQGVSLAQRVVVLGPIACEEASAIGLQILSALGAAHAAGIIHRDVKPANVMLAIAPTGSVAKLLDFGVAKVTDEVALTATGQVVGTPHYMAPEQVRHRGVDARTDVYGLGATLYHAVSGRRPFEDVPRQAVADAICQGPPERLSELKPSLAPAFVAIVERAMAKRPEDRFASAAEMTEALQRWLERDAPQPAAVNASTLTETPPDPPAPALLARAKEPPMPKPGNLVAGKFRIDRVVGQGGMGIVYAARHIVLDQDVALKLLLSVPDGHTTSRFVNEAKLAARIKSEHVCRVLDAGTLDTGQPFIAMELLDGTDLGKFVRTRGALPVPEAVGYVLETLEALAQAHGLKVVHRDLKPSNLFLSNLPSGETCLKVLDFGISKSLEGDGQTHLTATGAIVGSPTYMSPEQARSPSDIDTRSDIWSIGVVLYELLTGVSPFASDAIGAVFHMIFTKTPDSIRALRPDVPEALDQIVMRCLEKDPAQRFPDVYALAVALAPFAPQDARRGLVLERIRSAVGAEPSQPISQVSVAAPPPPRSSAVPYVLAAVVACALGGGGVLLWKTRSHAPLSPPTTALATPDPVVGTPSASASPTEATPPTVLLASSTSPASPASSTPATKAAAASTLKSTAHPKSSATADSLLDRRH